MNETSVAWASAQCTSIIYVKNSEMLICITVENVNMAKLACYRNLTAGINGRPNVTPFRASTCEKFQA
jgi:hypothetical protein